MSMIIFTILGIICVVFQLVVFREFTFSIAKNELSFVLAAGMWLFFCSLGSMLGRKKQVIGSAWISPLLALIFCLALAAIHLGKTWFGLAYYEVASLGFVTISAAILVGMVSFCMGYLFATFTGIYLKQSPTREDTYAKFFAWEAIGFFIGGVVFAFWLSSYINPFIFSFLAILLLFGISLRKSIKLLSFVAIVGIGLIFLLAFPGILTKEFKEAKIEKLLGSHYGPIFVTDKFDTQSLYANGSLIATSEDVSWNETVIHTSMAAAATSKNVLYIGPYFSGQVEEILKYPEVQLECLDINPVLSRISRDKIPKYLQKRVNFIVDDPRVYIAQSKKTYDVIIMNISAPSTLALNRYFTVEFFNQIKQRLKRGGVFSFFIPSKRDILSPQILKFNSCIINTTNGVFQNTLFIPGDSMLILAKSEGILSLEQIIKRFSQMAKTDYFSVYHLKDYLDPKRISYVKSNVDVEINDNRDLYPWGFLYYLLMEQRKFYPNLTINVARISQLIIVIVFILAIVISLLSLFKKKLSSLINVAILGFSSIGMTAMLFLLFQLYSGALFWKMGVLVGLFMVGLSTGTFLINRFLMKRNAQQRMVVLLFLMWTAFVGSLFLGVHLASKVFYLDFIFYGYSFLSGSLTGAGYPLFIRFLLREDPSKNVAVSVYAADLIGAFIGTLAFSIILVPFMGMGASLLVVLAVLVIFSIKSIVG